MSLSAKIARPSSTNFFILVGLTLGFGWLLASGGPLWFEGLTVFMFIMLGWLVSVCLHEWGHAYVAHLGGDTTVRDRGYLTLDPFHYTNPMTSIAMPLIIVAMGGIGLPGGAVYLRLDLLRSDAWRVATYLAGPAMSGLFGLFLALLVTLRGAPEGGELFWNAVALLAFLQVTAFFFNLLPLPGFDGFGALSVLLPPGAVRAAHRLAPVIMIGFIMAVVSYPRALQPLFDAAFGAVDTLGVSPRRVIAGLRSFQFWR